VQARALDPLRAGRLEDGRAAHRDDRGVRLGRDRPPVHGRIAHEYERAGGRVELLAVELEPRPAAQDDVQLLVPAAVDGLGVALDDLLAGALGGVAADAGHARPQRGAKRAPHELGAAPRHRLDLVEAHRRPALAARRGRHSRGRRTPGRPTRPARA
jgi:hypothetical protein